MKRVWNSQHCDFILMKKSTLENGTEVNFNSIYQADKNEFISFSTGESDFKPSFKKLFGAENEASGSCFVTLSSKHFLQIGGSSGTTKIVGPAHHTETALRRVKLYSFTNRQLLELGHSRGRFMDQARANQVSN